MRKESNAPFNVDNVRVCKIPGAGVLSSTVAKGMVFKRTIEGEVTHVEHAKVWVVSLSWNSPLLYDIFIFLFYFFIVLPFLDRSVHLPRGQRSH